MKIRKGELAPAPRFSVDFETGVNLATIYGGHFDRMSAVVDAARSGNQLLVTMALNHLDEYGSGP